MTAYNMPEYGFSRTSPYQDRIFKNSYSTYFTQRVFFSKCGKIVERVEIHKR